MREDRVNSTTLIVLQWMELSNKLKYRRIIQMQQLNQLVLDENNIAFNPMMGNSYQLNDISKDIVVLLRKGKTKDEIISEIMKSYDVDENDLFIDLSDFISKLSIYGLI